MAKNIKKELPQVLVLKRQFQQRFPNGQMVSLYHSDHLNQFVTIPLDNSHFSTTTESIIDQLSNISEVDGIDTIVFEDLSELNINKECADIILEYITENPDAINIINNSDTKFLELLEIAVNVTMSEESESDTNMELTDQ